MAAVRFTSDVLEVAYTAGGVSTVANRIERATVYEGAQLGVEVTNGTPVTATKRLQGIEIDFDAVTDIKPYRPQGNKFFTNVQVGKEMTTGRIQGILCYNDMLYLASSWLSLPVITTPSASPVWNVTNATGTVGFTYKGQTLTPATYATPALFQAAIGAMTSVGAGNVLVTSSGAGLYAITFTGALSTDTSAITAAAGSPLPVITNAGAATLTRRWTMFPTPFGPDQVNTFTIEKGMQGQAGMGQRAAFAFVHALTMKYTKAEATVNGDFSAQATTDPFTLTTAGGGVTDLACVPVNPKDCTVYMGSTLSTMAVMDRVLDMEFGVVNRADGLMTLNANDTSFSNRVEMAPDLTVRFFLEHDSNGQAMLANMRAGLQQYLIVETTGSSIETGFPYRMKWTMKIEMLKPNTADIDGVYGKNYDAHLMYDTTLGTAIKLEIDTPITAL